MTAPTNFLTLVQRTFQECGLSNNPPAAVTNQVNMAAKVVNWVLDAHAQIQEDRDWKFDWASVSLALTAGQDAYDPVTHFGIAGGVKRWERHARAAYVYPAATGTAGRLWLHYLDYNEMRGLNVPAISNGVPIYWSERPDGAIVYFPAPGEGYTAVHEFYHAPEVLADNGDEPRMPARFLMRIVWRAVQLYCGHDGYTGRGDLLENARLQERRVADQMMASQSAQYLSPGSLA